MTTIFHSSPLGYRALLIFVLIIIGFYYVWFRTDETTTTTTTTTVLETGSNRMNAELISQFVRIGSHRLRDTLARSQELNCCINNKSDICAPFTYPSPIHTIFILISSEPRHCSYTCLKMYAYVCTSGVKIYVFNCRCFARARSLIHIQCHFPGRAEQTVARGGRPYGAPNCLCSQLKPQICDLYGEFFLPPMYRVISRTNWNSFDLIKLEYFDFVVNCRVCFVSKYASSFAHYSWL